MRSARSRPVVLALLGLAGVLEDAAAERRFVEFGTGRGLDATVVPALLVDRDGLLWVGSREGLYRYDGYQATAFLPSHDDPTSISDVDVRALYPADDGALWVATNTGGLNRRDPRSGRFQRYLHASDDPRSLSDPSAYGMAQDSDGRLWVGTQHGLNRLDAEGRGFTRYFHEPDDAASLAHDWVYAVHRGPSGRLWIGTVGGGLDRWEPASRRFVHHSLAKLTGGPGALDDVFAIHETPDGRVWAGTRAGLVVLDRDGTSARIFDLGSEAGAQPLVTAMHADVAGQLWLATLAHGVCVVDTGSGQWSRADPGSLGAPGNLPAQAALSVVTTEHLLLVGTWGSGVFRAPREAPVFRLLAPAADGGGLRHKNVTAVLGRDEPGRPWAGSFGGGPQRVDVESGVALAGRAPEDDSIRGSGVLSLAAMPDGKLFAGTTAGVYRFDADGRNLGLDAHRPGRPDGIGAGYIGALLPAGGGDLWVGAGGTGLFLREASSGRFRAFRHDPSRPGSLSGDYVTALSSGRPGELWVGTRSDGLNRCRVEPWSCERFDDGSAGRPRLGHHHVTALRRDHAGSLWVATDGGGLHRVLEAPDGTVRGLERWDATSGLLNDGIMSVEQDADGSLWLATRHGLSRLDPATGRVQNHVLESGLPVDHFNTGASSADARYVYFGSVEGLVSLPKGTPLEMRPASPLRVTGIERLAAGAGQPFAPGAIVDGFEVDHGDGLAVEFAVLDFAESPHEYAYRLATGDDWTPLGRRRQVTFLGLDPGRYRFEVRGRDVFGQWSTSPTLEFEVVPPFWMTWWFRGLALATVAFLALALHLGRLRSLRQRNAVLERLESQREQALERARHVQRELEEAYAGLSQLMDRLESAKEEERSRISRELHDEFGQTLTAAKINLQMLHRATADATVAQRLDDSVRMVDGMIRQARDIALGLRPPLLDEAGLVPALDHHLKSLAERSGVAIEFDASPGAAAIPQGLNTTVFRVAQEAVSNALRHARPSRIRVALRDAGSAALRLTVEDDGIGFDPAAVNARARRGEHLGLLGMTERVKAAGGTLEFDSRPGGGCRIEVHFPHARPLAVAATPVA